MKITPVGVKYLVRRDEPEKETSAGIIVPKESITKPLTGTIEMVGLGALINGVQTDCRLSAGQRVLFGSYSGTSVQNDEDLLIMGEDEILAVIS